MALTRGRFRRARWTCASPSASGAARGRLVAVLEGGYDLDGIAEASAAVVGRMLGRPLATAAPDVHRRSAALSDVCRQASLDGRGRRPPGTVSTRPSSESANAVHAATGRPWPAC